MKILAPQARKKHHETKLHGKVIKDDYFWLRDKSWPNIKNKEILDYLQEENEYSACYFKKIENLQRKIYRELISRIKLDDKTVSIKKRNHLYSTQTFKTKQYKKHIRTNCFSRK
ncbi:MAG: hypothetical protein RLN62_02200, partial [Rickettsiales bacterium]